MLRKRVDGTDSPFGQSCPPDNDDENLFNTIKHATVFKRLQEDVMWLGDALKVELAHSPPGASCYDS